MDDANSGRRDINTNRTGDELANLRSLLFSPEQAELAKLKERLDEPKIHAVEVSSVLAEAIVIRASRDKKLAQALLPTIEQAIQDSVRKNPKFLADAIFPIIGPSIRKAISESIRAMVQSLNEALTYALSWQGFKWRLEALRTGKPFAEIVLLHTLIYWVEQIFLIHKETGLLLQHVSAKSSDIKDVDTIPGMLTAIQDFVHDSFDVDENQVIQSLNIGEYVVWIEQGSQTALAAIIRGNPPEEFRRDLKEALEKIEFEQSQILQSFDGDTTPFNSSNHHLKTCLIQAKSEIKNPHKVPEEAASLKANQGKKNTEHDLLWWIIGAGIISLLIILAGIALSLAH